MRRAIVFLLLLPPFPAVAQDPGAGAQLAVRWCMACHVVESNPPRASDSAPSFRSIAADPKTTADFIDRYISRGHTLMPDFSLSAQERTALVVYILNLR